MPSTIGGRLAGLRLRTKVHLNWASSAGEESHDRGVASLKR